MRGLCIKVKQNEQDYQHQLHLFVHKSDFIAVYHSQCMGFIIPLDFIHISYNIQIISITSISSLYILINFFPEKTDKLINETLYW